MAGAAAPGAMATPPMTFTKLLLGFLCSLFRYSGGRFDIEEWGRGYSLLRQAQAVAKALVGRQDGLRLRELRRIKENSMVKLPFSKY